MNENGWDRLNVLLCPSCIQLSLYVRTLPGGRTVQCYGSPLFYPPQLGYGTCEWAMDLESFVDIYRPIVAPLRPDLVK